MILDEDKAQIRQRDLCGQKEHVYSMRYEDLTFSLRRKNGFCWKIKTNLQRIETAGSPKWARRKSEAIGRTIITQPTGDVGVDTNGDLDIDLESPKWKLFAGSTDISPGWCATRRVFQIYRDLQVRTRRADDAQQQLELREHKLREYRISLSSVNGDDKGATNSTSALPSQPSKRPQSIREEKKQRGIKSWGGRVISPVEEKMSSSPDDWRLLSPKRRLRSSSSFNMSFMFHDDGFGMRPETALKQKAIEHKAAIRRMRSSETYATLGNAVVVTSSGDVARPGAARKAPPEDESSFEGDSHTLHLDIREKERGKSRGRSYHRRNSKSRPRSSTSHRSRSQSRDLRHSSHDIFSDHSERNDALSSDAEADTYRRKIRSRTKSLSQVEEVLEVDQSSRNRGALLRAVGNDDISWTSFLEKEGDGNLSPDQRTTRGSSLSVARPRHSSIGRRGSRSRVGGSLQRLPGSPLSRLQSTRLQILSRSLSQQRVGKSMERLPVLPMAGKKHRIDTDNTEKKKGSTHDEDDASSYDSDKGNSDDEENGEIERQHEQTLEDTTNEAEDSKPSLSLLAEPKSPKQRSVSRGRDSNNRGRSHSSGRQRSSKNVGPSPNRNTTKNKRRGSSFNEYYNDSRDFVDTLVGEGYRVTERDHTRELRGSRSRARRRSTSRGRASSVERQRRSSRDSRNSRSSREPNSSLVSRELRKSSLSAQTRTTEEEKGEEDVTLFGSWGSSGFSSMLLGTSI